MKSRFEAKVNILVGKWQGAIHSYQMENFTSKILKFIRKLQQKLTLTLQALPLNPFTLKV